MASPPGRFRAVHVAGAARRATLNFTCAIPINKKTPRSWGSVLPSASGGEGGIRTLDPLQDTRFRDAALGQLCDLSAATVSIAQAEKAGKNVGPCA